MRKFSTYSLNRSITSIDEYGQQKKEAFTEVSKLSIAVFLKTDDKLNNNPLFSKVSHIGIYKGSFTDFQKLDRLDNDYIVSHCIKGNRKILLYLEQVIK